MTELSIAAATEISPGVSASAVPLLRDLSPARLSDLPLDATSKRLLSRIDGVRSFDEVATASGIRATDAMPMWRRLVQRGIVYVRSSGE